MGLRYPKADSLNRWILRAAGDLAAAGKKKPFALSVSGYLQHSLRPKYICFKCAGGIAAVILWAGLACGVDQVMDRFRATIGITHILHDHCQVRPASDVAKPSHCLLLVSNQSDGMNVRVCGLIEVHESLQHIRRDKSVGACNQDCLSKQTVPGQR
jgi:hypothetical protein